MYLPTSDKDLLKSTLLAFKKRDIEQSTITREIFDATRSSSDTSTRMSKRLKSSS